MGLTYQGYNRITKKSKRQLEHRLVIEEAIGRKLLTDEEIHHINGIKTDNRIENLIILTKSAHAKHHSNLFVYKRLCKICSKKFIGLKTQLICNLCKTFKCEWCGILKVQKYHRADRMTYCSKECRNNASAKRFKENPPNIGRIPWNKK